MRRGGGKAKGAQYEREICKALSLWITHGKREDCFWRSAMSGGRATVGQRRGAVMDAHAGDISATHADGHPLTNHFFVECKRYADLNFGGFLTKDVGPLAGFWKVAVAEAAKYNKIPMLIVREDRGDTLMLVPSSDHLVKGVGHTFNFNPNAAVARLYRSKCDVYEFDQVVASQYNVPAIFRTDGFKLAPGELNRIMRGNTVPLTETLTAPARKFDPKAAAADIPPIKRRPIERARLDRKPIVRTRL